MKFKTGDRIILWGNPKKQGIVDGYKRGNNYVVRVYMKNVVNAQYYHEEMLDLVTKDLKSKCNFCPQEMVTRFAINNTTLNFCDSCLSQARDNFSVFQGGTENE